MNDKKIEVNFSLDCSGHLCPVPILMTEEKMVDLKSGDILEVIFTDPGAKPDLIAWCLATGNEFLNFKSGKLRSSACIRKE